MKRLISILLVSVLMILCVGCGDVDGEVYGVDEPNDPADTTTALGEDKTEPDVSDPKNNFLVTIRSNGVEFAPHEHFVWSQKRDEHGWLCSDGFSISGNFSAYKNEIPKLTYSDAAEIIYGDNVSLMRLSVYDSSSEIIKGIDDEKALQSLEKGEYFLELYLKKQGKYYEDDQKYDTWGYECIYYLIVE